MSVEQHDRYSGSPLSGQRTATFATLFLGLFCLLQLIVVAVSLMSAADVNKKPAPLQKSIPVWERTEERPASLNPDDHSATWTMCFVSVISIGVLLTVSAWIAQVHVHLGLFSVEGNRYSPTWAAGSFFIPILNLFMPYQMMQELWRASTPQGNLRDKLSWKANADSNLVFWWWAVALLILLVGGALYVVAFQVRPGTPMYAENVAILRIGNVVSGTLGVLDTILLIIVIQQIQKRQSMR